MIKLFKKSNEKIIYEMQMKRVESLPEDYQFVFKKAKNYMWNFAGSEGKDMLNSVYLLIELFETSSLESKMYLM